MSLIELAAKIRSRCITTEGGCLEWQGSRGVKGYGRTTFNGSRITTHRGLWIAERGEIPPGFQLDHLCRNPPCCNPEHLEPVTPAENARRGNAGLHMKARAREQLTCRHGHPRNAANTYRRKDGKTQCRACTQARLAKRRAEYREGGLTLAGEQRQRSLSANALTVEQMRDGGRYVR